jgi:hypothetical protein
MLLLMFLLLLLLILTVLAVIDYDHAVLAVAVILTSPPQRFAVA